VHEVRIIWNDDVDADLINLHHHRTPWDAVPTLARDYRVDVCVEGTWQTVADVEANRHRHRVHHVPRIRTTALRIVVTATNGSPFVTASAVKVS